MKWGSNIGEGGGNDIINRSYNPSGKGARG